MKSVLAIAVVLLLTNTTQALKLSTGKFFKVVSDDHGDVWNPEEDNLPAPKPTVDQPAPEPEQPDQEQNPEPDMPEDEPAPEEPEFDGEDEPEPAPEKPLSAKEKWARIALKNSGFR